MNPDGIYEVRAPAFPPLATRSFAVALLLARCFPRSEVELEVLFSLYPFPDVIVFTAQPAQPRRVK